MSDNETVDSLLHTIDRELDLRMAESARAGWNQWALLGAFVVASWAFLGLYQDYAGGNRFLLASLILLMWYRSVEQLIGLVRGRAVPPTLDLSGTRLRTLSHFLLSLAIAVCAIRLPSVGASATSILVAIVVFEALGVVLLFVMSFLFPLPVFLDSQASEFSRFRSAKRKLATTLAVPAAMLSAAILLSEASASLQVNDFQLAGALTVALLVLERLAATDSGEPTWSRLVILRRLLSAEAIGVDAARERLRTLLVGAGVAPLLKLAVAKEIEKRIELEKGAIDQLEGRVREVQAERGTISPMSSEKVGALGNAAKRDLQNAFALNKRLGIAGGLGAASRLGLRVLWRAVSDGLLSSEEIDVSGASVRWDLALKRLGDATGLSRRLSEAYEALFRAGSQRIEEAARASAHASNSPEGSEADSVGSSPQNG